MAEIQLTRGYVARVADEDFERINALKWFASVSPYQTRAARMQGRQMLYMHHFVLGVQSEYLKADDLEVDHMDGDPLNNHKENLRIVSHTDNMRNSARHVNRRGYCWNKRAKLYSVYLDEPGQRRKYLGYTRTEKEAQARLKEARSAYNSNR